ncbi:MAG: DEAD/DEAH box helicase [Bacteroidota bacterium]
MTFKDLNLIEPIQKALAEEGYKTPTPIQQQAIPHALEGKDVLGCAQTGTGKTAAFAIPVLQNLLDKLSPNGHRKIKTLVLTPTRELAIQIGDSFKAYSRHVKVRGTVIFGGVSQKPQESRLKKGIDVLVATPGRLLDLMNQGIISLADVEIFVLDEADRMLDMGFIHDVRRVIKALPEKRQTLFFSATMPKEIAKLAHDILIEPIRVSVTPVSSTAEKVHQTVFFVEKRNKKKLLIELLNNEEIVSALVFTRTKHGANRVARDLDRKGISAMAIHGNKSQTARQKALGNFKDGQIRVLVATDIAARGIDVEELSHVINFDLPNIPETYVHRIGRTGRAGLSGIALSFCDVEELPYLKDIQKLIRKVVPMDSDHPFHYDPNNPPEPAPKQERPPRNGRQNNNARKERSGRNDKPNHAERRSNRNQPKNNSGRHEEEEKAETVSASRNSRRRPNQRKKPTRNGSLENRSKKPTVKNTSDQNASEKNTREDGTKWNSIFQKPSSGKKGFVIKSDRFDKPKKKSGKRTYRGKKG